MSDAGLAVGQEQLDRLQAELERNTARHREIQEAIVQARQLLHDINQPLTTLMGNCELMLMRAAANDPNRAKLAVMVEQCERLRRMTVDLSEIIRSQSDEIRNQS